MAWIDKKGRERDVISCPCCDVDISIYNKKIPRHERGLRYVPYGLYHGFSRMSGSFINDLARRNLCPASGKTIEEANKVMSSTPERTSDKGR
jgi:hypothetical protein